MSNYTVIGDISETLQKLLEDDPWTGISPKPIISHKSPKEIITEPGNINKVLLYLYQITENVFLKNEKNQIIDSNKMLQPPLCLELFYLVTTYSNDPLQEKYILGKVMQIFFNNPVLSGSVLKGGLSGSSEEIKIIFNPLSLDDLTKIWGAFQDIPYKLSFSYMVTPVFIDSSVEISMQRVISKEINHGHFITKRDVK